jgi:hypothetical protein
VRERSERERERERELHYMFCGRALKKRQLPHAYEVAFSLGRRGRREEVIWGMNMEERPSRRRLVAWQSHKKGLFFCSFILYIILVNFLPQVSN